MMPTSRVRSSCYPGTSPFSALVVSPLDRLNPSSMSLDEPNLPQGHLALACQLIPEACLTARMATHTQMWTQHR